MNTEKIYTVKFKKRFIQGNLKGLEYPTSLDFSNLDLANWYADFLHAHTEKPVYSLDSSYYTCNSIEILKE